MPEIINYYQAVSLSDKDYAQVSLVSNKIGQSIILIVNTVASAVLSNDN